MTDLSQKIRDYLFEHPNGVKMRELERAVGVHERGLQGEGKEPGLFRVAIAEIYRETGWMIYSRSGRGGGVFMTRDRSEVELAAQRLRAHAFHEVALADLLTECIRDAAEKEAALHQAENQFTLPLTA